MASFVLPTNFALVGAVGAATYWLNVFQAGVVSKHRKLSGIKYPNYMADKATAEANPAAHKFNCAQRAHANLLENLPTFLFGLVYSGLYYPKVASSLGALWIVGRVFYTLGYTTGEPAKRNSGLGPLHVVGYYGLMLFTTYVAGSKVYDLIK